MVIALALVTTVADGKIVFPEELTTTHGEQTLYWAEITLYVELFLTRMIVGMCLGAICPIPRPFIPIVGVYAL